MTPEMKQQILDALHGGTLKLSFKKINGDIREMVCTLNPELLPPVPVVEATDKPKPERKKNPDNQSVWDIDKQAWRSFKWENVIV